MKLLRSWAKKGNGNTIHLLYIISAQLAVLEGKEKKSKITSNQQSKLHLEIVSYEIRHWRTN